jgi:hypothetical protein
MTELVQISETEMRRHLREACSQDPEKSFLSQIVERLADPAKPRSEKGVPRPHPLWFQLAAVFCLAVFVFLYFTFGRP